MDSTIQINFNRMMPLFPLSGVVLLPHAVQHLHIFEKRYRQMVRHCLDSAGQIAVASFADESWQEQYEGSPDLRPAACIGQVIHHHRFSDGRFNIVLLGICRATILEIEEPEGDRLYRRARMSLLEDSIDAIELDEVRDRLQRMIQRPSIHSVRGMSKVAHLFDRDDVPTNALVELTGGTLMDDPELRYRLLAEPDVRRRAALVDQELRHVDWLVKSAAPQLSAEWPKGQSWN